MYTGEEHSVKERERLLGAKDYRDIWINIYYYIVKPRSQENSLQTGV